MRKALAVITVSIGLLAAGCGSSGTSGGESASAPAAKQMRVGYASALDPNDVADQLGLEMAGAKVTTLTDDSTVVAGLMRDSLDVGNVDFDAAIKAKSSGVPIKIIYVAQMKPEYDLVARPEITSLDQLAGKRVGYHAPGSQTDIFVHSLLKEKIPAQYDKVKFLALEESSRRAQALASNKLDAAVLEAINFAALKQQGDYHELGTWADLTGDASQARGTAWITTDQKYASDKTALTTLVTSLQKGYDKTYADKNAWLAAAKKAVPEVDQSLLPAVYDTYTREGMYPKAGEPPITPESFKTTEKFFRDLGGWKDEQSDAIVAFDLVKAGAGSTQ
ncbi:ABC transporter substrate-binding protein [Nonomuraea sp. M3C6]|uniref:ABC transporter substrate-binding protein n=1 Tax=Nonomuraea marmarensis TaxID=3351344 RepID=A0ABW7ATK6_9ACTN